MGIRPLPPHLAQIAAEELNENPKRIPEDLKAINDWLDKQPHLNARRDEEILVGFLRGNKYSLERTKEKMDMYYTMKTACPELFGNRDPLEPNNKAMLDQGVVVQLPNPHSDGSRITLSRPYHYDPNKNRLEHMVKFAFMVGDLNLLEDDDAVVAGQTCIIDLKDMTMAHTVQGSATFLKKFAVLIQDAYPFRIKAFHYINVPPIFDMIFKIFSQFISVKMRKRLFLHGSIDELYAHIPKKSLPSEYGGEIGSIESLKVDLFNKLHNKRAWFVEDIKYKSDESKRLGKPKNSDILFGIEGSFRKLDID